MFVTGELKCLHCGFVSGKWVGERGHALTASGFKGLPAETPRTDASGNVACTRCAGPVFLDDVAPVISSYRLRRIQRLREQIAALDRQPRRAA